MNATKILDSEISSLKVASLPSRPTAPTAFGGKGYTASEMKAAFDRLPLFIVERFNQLIEDIGSVGEMSLAGGIPTGIYEDHTLAELFSDIKSGSLAGYMQVLGENLDNLLARILENVAALENSSGENGTAISDIRLSLLEFEGELTKYRDAVLETKALEKRLEELLLLSGDTTFDNIIIDCGTPCELLAGGDEE